MKKLFNNTNPFILLLAPVLFALIMGVSYQFKQRKINTTLASTERATSLFVKGVTLIKTVCSIGKVDVW